MLAKSKLNSIKTLIFHALIDMDISYEKFVTILNKKDKYEKMKDNLRSENEEYKIMRLRSIKSYLKKNKHVTDNLHNWRFSLIKIKNTHQNFVCVCIYKWLILPKKHLRTMT